MQIPEPLKKEDTSISDWYGEIYPAAPRVGFFYSWADHAVQFVQRSSKLLLVSFDDPQNQNRFPCNLDGWCSVLARKRGWSQLVVQSRQPRWYRDENLIDLFQTLSSEGFFADFQNTSLVGTSMGGFGALAFAGLVPGAIVVAVDPQSTLDPNIAHWDKRFSEAENLDWNLPFSDAAGRLDEAGNIYVLYDPLLKVSHLHVDRISDRKLIRLKMFGCGEKIGTVLQRINQFDTVMECAITDELQTLDFYRAIRRRKDVYAYRRSMEHHLSQRGKGDLIDRFRTAFRDRAENNQNRELAPPQPDISPQENLQKSQRPGQRAVDFRPPPKGNVWMLEDRAGAWVYMSDQYRKRVMGFETRGDVTLAQTPDTAIGILSFGGGSTLVRPVSEGYEFHVVDETLNGLGPATGACGHAIAAEIYKDINQRPLRTILAISSLQSGITANEAEPDQAAYQQLLKKVASAYDALQAWDKALFVDRIALRLLTGEMQATEEQAAAHYVAVARALRRDIPRITGQGSFPLFVLSQSAGSRTDGGSGVILAEGRLNLDSPTIGFIVAGPSYPFTFMDQMPATHSPDSQMLIDELEALAVSEVQRGRPWQCPSLRFALQKSDTITAEFTTLSGLNFEGEPAGFALQGCENEARIVSVRANGQTVEIVCDKAPKGQALWLRYGWGMTADGTGTYAANSGNLRDSWSAASLTCPDVTLYRYALSGRVKVIENWG